MLQNPFSTTFSKAPSATYIPTEQERAILDNFSSSSPSESVYKITGIRGSGKTVIMAKVEEALRSEEKAKEGWLVFDLNPERDLLVQMAANLAKAGLGLPETKVKNVTVSASLAGFGAQFGMASDTSSVRDIGVEIDGMLQKAKKQGKKILIGIDEMSKTKTMVEFVSEFGRWLRADFPVYLVCTGLYENILDLSSVKNLTFFLRATTVKAERLNFVKMASVYQKELHVSLPMAKTMAEETKGYAYAFQILGRAYFAKKENEDLSEVLRQAKIELFSYSYEKIYEELSPFDRAFVSLFSDQDKMSREEILAALGKDSPSYSSYRDRLLKRGLLVSPQYGMLALALPYFGEYLKEYHPLQA